MRSIFAILAATAVSATALAVAPQTPEPAWGPAPAVFPAGAKMAVLQGDPSQSAMFTVRLDMPDGYKIAPHFHPTDEQITVIAGTFVIGMGDNAATDHTMTLPVGGFATAAAGQHHFARAQGRTIVQVNAMGPFALTYVDPKDDPRGAMPSK